MLPHTFADPSLTSKLAPTIRNVCMCVCVSFGLLKDARYIFAVDGWVFVYLYAISNVNLLGSNVII